ncbi:hypothetical protein [Stenotrophomonas sp. PS02289]|uniref:hypothetical protein n=1 Tax=Stenotrophomonas sp. PS02289 TaxID=2991422 RepID=UPI00249B70DC|nr:hypothetical protein [Stenotrophomonas sp. PS02289]
MKGKYWPDHLALGYIEIDGVQHSLEHLKPFCYVVHIEEQGKAETPIQVTVEFSSHCVTKGPRTGELIDFSQAGFAPLVIDQRRNWRKFLPARYTASTVLPEIMRTLSQRSCFFASERNYLTLEMNEVIPGYPEGTQYEIYFNVKQRGNLSVHVYVESAYVRDPCSGSDPYRFRKEDRINGWRLLLNRGTGRAVRRPPSRRR